MTWTREDDLLLATKCEGWNPGEYEDRWISPDGVEQFVLPDYEAEPAAEKRAAEAWRLQKPVKAWSEEQRLRRRETLARNKARCVACALEQWKSRQARRREVAK